MNKPNRRLTINSKGEIVEAPYGAGRWASPRIYACAHDDCERPATVLTSADAHDARVDADAPTVVGAHNCCGHH